MSESNDPKMTIYSKEKNKSLEVLKDFSIREHQELVKTLIIVVAYCLMMLT